MNRSNSCINDSALQCSIKCIQSPFSEHKPLTENYYYKKNQISKSPSSTLNKRRQRNLTSINTSSLQIKETKQQDYLEEFLDSLEDINNYLEKKLATRTPNIPKIHPLPSSNINKVTNKRTRRNLTQPITFNNELHAITKNR